MFRFRLLYYIKERPFCGTKKLQRPQQHQNTHSQCRRNQTKVLSWCFLLFHQRPHSAHHPTFFSLLGQICTLIANPILRLRTCTFSFCKALKNGICNQNASFNKEGKKGITLGEGTSSNVKYTR